MVRSVKLSESMGATTWRVSLILSVKVTIIYVLKPTIANVNGQEVIQAGAVTLYYSNGDMARPDDRVWNDISFDVLTPTAKDIIAAKD